MIGRNCFYRDTWVEVDLDAIKANVINMKKKLPENVQVMAVVKSNGYGHGAVQVAKAAIDAGASVLGVAILDEALALRNAGIDLPILVLGYIRPEDVMLAVENRITVTIYQAEWIEKVATFLTAKDNLSCHIKIDSGMGRLGIRTKEEGKALTDSLEKSPFFEIEGIYTHFATADELDTTFFEKQQQMFVEFVDWMEKLLGQVIPIKHCANSATALRFSDRCYNLIRFGISMYGLSPSEEMKAVLPFSLKEAFSLHSKITHVKEVDPGTSISYGATYKTVANEWIGTIPIGYADGWIRANNIGEVLVNGERAPIVGRICMDQMMILLKGKVSIGTKVTLIGTQGNEMIPVDEIAQRLNTINYEIPCSISYRVPRIFISNENVIHVENGVF